MVDVPAEIHERQLNTLKVSLAVSETQTKSQCLLHNCNVGRCYSAVCHFTPVMVTPAMMATALLRVAFLGAVIGHPTGDFREEEFPWAGGWKGQSPSWSRRQALWPQSMQLRFLTSRRTGSRDGTRCEEGGVGGGGGKVSWLKPQGLSFNNLVLVRSRLPKIPQLPKKASVDENQIVRRELVGDIS